MWRQKHGWMGEVGAFVRSPGIRQTERRPVWWVGLMKRREDLLDRSPWMPPAPENWPPAERFPGDWYPQLHEAFVRLQAQRHDLLAGSVAQWLRVAPLLEERGAPR